MGLWDKAKKVVQDAQEEIEEKVSDKLMQEEMNRTLRENSGEPMNTDKKGK